MAGEDQELVQVELDLEDGRKYRTQLYADDPRITDEAKARAAAPTKARTPAPAKGDVKTK
jgi:hypothetical protein